MTIKVWAMVLIYKTIPALFMKFELELVDPEASVNEWCSFPVKWRNVYMRLRSRGVISALKFVYCLINIDIDIDIGIEPKMEGPRLCILTFE
jgi:hypothetical protein